MRESIHGERKSRSALYVFLLFIILFISAEIYGYLVLTSFGEVDVSNVWIKNTNDLMVRGKLFIPKSAAVNAPVPGVLYLHGYQNNRETSEPYAIELSRRGIAVLSIDTLGRGNSDNQFSESEPGFDETYGGRSAFEYLQALPLVDPEKCGIGGHSLGAEMAYTIASSNPDVAAIIFSGFAYDINVDMDMPKNMLMIFGKYDEYRERMTATDDFELEWMTSPQTRAAIPDAGPVFDKTYGSFADGSARRVHMTNTTHVGECFNSGAIAEGVAWFMNVFEVEPQLKSSQQIWRIKEVCSFIAMITAVFSIIPLVILLLRTKIFRILAGRPGKKYYCSRIDFWKASLSNGFLSLLYLPLILVIFGIHVYLFRIDKVFPMMMVNGIVFWFIVINIIGFLLFRRWFKKSRRLNPELDYIELGISAEKYKIRPAREVVAKAFLLAAILFAYLYILESGFEKILMIDFRYKFPYASDFTVYRFLMFIEYFILFLAGYFQFNIFIQAQIRPIAHDSWLVTAVLSSIRNILVIVIPLLVIIAVQYIPLLFSGVIPFTGPGGALIGFVINIEHMCVLLFMMIVLSTFIYNCTGAIYTGMFINAMIVSWMFTSSSVIAPLPI